MFKYIDLFAGMGGIRIGLEQALREKGIEGKCVLTSEIKPYALEVYKDNFGDDNIVGDIREVQGCDIPDFDMLLAGFPCFVGGTYIYTDLGLKEIENIKIGDMVYTHNNRFRKVLETMKQVSDDVYELNIISNKIENQYIKSIRATGNHPFLVKESNTSECVEKWVSFKDLREGMYLYMPYELLRNQYDDILLETETFFYGTDEIKSWVKIDEKPNKIEGKFTVYNLTVEEDNTYIADGFAVHNCQSFSIAGKRMGFEDTRGTLFFEIARILKDKKPKYFLLENVENLIRHDLSKEDKKAGKTMGKTLETILNTLTDLGYKVSWKILAASDYGVAQIRKRIYIVGSLDKEISLEDFEKKTVNFGEIQEYGKPCVDSHFTRCLFKYLNDNNLPISHLYNKAIRDKRGSDNNIHSWTIGLRGEVSDVQKRLLDKMVPERRRVDYAKKKNMPIIEGIGLDMDELSLIYDGDNLERDIKELIEMGYVIEKNYDTWPKPCYDVIGGRLSYEFTKIFDPNKPALTLVATEVGKNAVVDGNGIRKLTITEGLRLNGYPDDYKLNLDYRKAMDLLGNTVVVPIIKMICDRIIEDK